MKSRRVTKHKDAAGLLLEVNESGVLFKSYRDGAMVALTPESSVAAQKKLGADVIVPLDEKTHIRCHAINSTERVPEPPVGGEEPASTFGTSASSDVALDHGGADAPRGGEELGVRRFVAVRRSSSSSAGPCREDLARDGEVVPGDRVLSRQTQGPHIR